MLRCLIIGMISTTLLFLATALSDYLGISVLRNLKRTVFFAFITIATASELGKFIGFRYFIIRRSENISPSDTIALSISTSMGFSMVALFLYVFEVIKVEPTLPMGLFPLIYVPANLLFSVVMGFFIGMARFLKTHIVYSLTGLIVAIFFHGIFIFCLITRDYKLLSLFAFGSSMIITFLAMKAINTVPETLK
jgi:RsiW-degrading membrane proteinase PrsW (M82 family)